MTSAAAASIYCSVPIKVTHVISVFADFHYPSIMSVGEVVEMEPTVKISWICNAYLKFQLKKTSEHTVSVICERHAEDRASNAGSTEVDEFDGGCFLRLYISVLGVMEKPKCAVLRYADAFASVEFMEASFMSCTMRLDRVFTLKCIFRRIETSVLLSTCYKNEVVSWAKLKLKANSSEEGEKRMTLLLRFGDVDNLFTGRITAYGNLVGITINRAYHYSEELDRYFEATRHQKPIQRRSNLGIILGYLRNGTDVTISREECKELYFLSVFEGMMFLKKLCTAYIIENLDAEFVIDALALADTIEDAPLFEAASRFLTENELDIFNSPRWQRLAREKVNVSRSISHSVSLRRLTDNRGFPPAIEDETGQRY